MNPPEFLTCELCTADLCPGCAGRLATYYLVLQEAARPVEAVKPSPPILAWPRRLMVVA